jgi:hypothetical protein
LSTFSGHMKQVNRIISRANTGTLVLLDELGSGTGSYLSIANVVHGGWRSVGLGQRLVIFDALSLLSVGTCQHINMPVVSVTCKEHTL